MGASASSNPAPPPLSAAEATPSVVDDALPPAQQQQAFPARNTNTTETTKTTGRDSASGTAPPAAANNTSTIVPTTTISANGTNSARARPKKEQRKRAGFDLVQYKCRRRKAAYDKCYNEWYGKKFLTAQDIERDESCDELFDVWKECILRGMVKEREKQGLGPPKAGSILGEYLEEQNDNDDEQHDEE